MRKSVHEGSSWGRLGGCGSKMRLSKVVSEPKLGLLVGGRVVSEGEVVKLAMRANAKSSIENSNGSWWIEGQVRQVDDSQEADRLVDLQAQEQVCREVCFFVNGMNLQSLRRLRAYVCCFCVAEPRLSLIVWMCCWIDRCFVGGHFFAFDFAVLLVACSRYCGACVLGLSSLARTI